MKLYFAPLEGITGYIYRNAHHSFFPGADKYFTPFIAPNQNRALSPKEIRDVLPENNEGIYLVPQILTNNSEYFIRAAKELKEKYGYGEVNLNLGCPAGTVVSKGKGAGFLAKKEELDRFLEEIFEKAEVKISVKTRIGKEAKEEFYELIEIYNKYPLHELIIHPRIQTDFYKNKPDRKVFADAWKLSENPVCYNGDIFIVQNYESFCNEFPDVDCMMLGRGLLVNPDFIGNIREYMPGNRDKAGGIGTEETINKKAVDKCRLKEFHDKLYTDYREALSGDINVLFKMKELWFYMIHIFTDYEGYEKKIRKATQLCDYEEIINRMFREQEIIEIR